MRPDPQSLIPSSPGTTSFGSKAPAAGRTWCAPTRNPLFLRRRAPRLPGPRRRRPRGETGLRLGAKGTEEQGFAGFRAPSPRRPRAENGLKLGAKVTEEQGFAGFRAPSPRRPRGETGLRLGAKGTEEQGFAGIRAPSPRRPRRRAIQFFHF